MNINIEKVTNFKGLWGTPEIKTKTVHGLDETVYAKNFKIYDIKNTYFPFKDETDKKINNVKRINTVNYKNFNLDKFVYTSQYNKKCDVEESLPITEQEFKDYKANRLDPMTANDIEDTLQVFALEKYLNKDEN